MNKVFWFTGLSGAGKSTLAHALKLHLHHCMMLDGDIMREGLSSDLSFSVADRNENIRRIAEVAKIGYLSGNHVIVSFISPIKRLREFARSLIPKGDFVEIYVNTPLAICEGRDTKGLYAKVREGKIPDFTGISSPYEAPENPEVVIETVKTSIEDAVIKILQQSNTVDIQKPHDAFIGRWNPFHKGHFAIMEKVYKENERPLLIFVRDTDFDEYPANLRKEMVEYSMKTMNIPATVQIIPDLKSINWGRGVGYETNVIEVPEDIKDISATAIRKKMRERDDVWKEWVCPGVAEFLESHAMVLEA